jgi:hypothetical protein
MAGGKGDLSIEVLSRGIGVNIFPRGKVRQIIGFVMWRVCEEGP